MPPRTKNPAEKAWVTRRKNLTTIPDVLRTEAAKWYREFLERTSTEKGGDFKGYKGGDSDKAWTEYMEQVLRSWGEEEYDVVCDFDSPSRIDVIWRKNKQDKVAIEHENDGDTHGRPLEESGIGREIEKLLDNTSAPLRVLITYFKNSAFGKEIVNLQAQLEEEIRTRGKHDFEFLLLAGPWGIAEPQEFVAYIFRPKIISEFIPPYY
jgi:hypothetical protein